MQLSNFKKTCFITPYQMRRIDTLAQKKYHVPGIVLMENAGRSVSEKVLETLIQKNKKRGSVSRHGRSVACVCGKGNNAGDGFVCARHLINNGIKTDIFILAGERDFKGDALTNLLILKAMRPKSIMFLKNSNFFKHLKTAAKKSDVVVDAIFGIGLNSDVKYPYSEAIELINKYCSFTLSVDVPSGFDALTGEAGEFCVKSDVTVTFGLPKVGFRNKAAKKYTGRVIVADISIPQALLKSPNITRSGT